MSNHSVSRVVRAARKAVYRACSEPTELVRWRVPLDMTARLLAAEEAGYRMALGYESPSERFQGCVASTGVRLARLSSSSAFSFVASRVTVRSWCILCRTSAARLTQVPQNVWRTT